MLHFICVSNPYIPGFPVQNILAIEGPGSILYANLMQNPPLLKTAQNPKSAYKNKVITTTLPFSNVVLEINLTNNHIVDTLQLPNQIVDGNSIAASKNILFESIAITSHASIKVFNSLGQQVAVLLNSDMQRGVHEVRLNADSYPSGVYYYEVNTNGIREVEKMLYIK